MLATIGLRILMLGLPILFDILYKYVQKRFGLALVELTEENIAVLEKKKRTEAHFTSEMAEQTNINMIIAATQQSPGIGKSWAKFINWVCYMRFTEKNYKGKWRKLCDDVARWQKTGAPNRSQKDFDRMGLYLKRH